MAFSWRKRFRSLDVRLLQCIASIWPTCLSVLPSQPLEDSITFNLVEIFKKNREARRLFYWIQFYFEPPGYSASGAAYSKGKIDMAVFLDQDGEKYLAYECKRLNVVNKGSRESLATKYVKDGVKRFVTEQYAEHLPTGAMLGYVMDGDISFAQSKVQVALDANQEEVNMISRADSRRSHRNYPAIPDPASKRNRRS